MDTWYCVGTLHCLRALPVEGAVLSVPLERVDSKWLLIHLHSAGYSRVTNIFGKMTSQTKGRPSSEAYPQCAYMELLLPLNEDALQFVTSYALKVYKGFSLTALNKCQKRDSY